jgi:hypothetical protein
LDDSRPYFAPNAAVNLNCRNPRRPTPWSTLGAHLYFIAVSVKSEREEQKETRIGANADSKTRNCPELERLTVSIEKIGMNN